MEIKNGLVPGYFRLREVRELSREAKQRVKWFDFYKGHGNNGVLTCRYFGISRKTFYKWRRLYDLRDLNSLKDRSRKPRHTRQPTWSPELAQAVLRLREGRPRWGKDKSRKTGLQEEGWEVSTSMVGRILIYLKGRNLLREPVSNGVSCHKRRYPRPYAVRKPKGYEVREPGDLVEVDTLDIRPLPGVVLKHFTARDVVSRWDVLEVHTRATATTATSFLGAIQGRMPFMVKAIQSLP